MVSWMIPDEDVELIELIHRECEQQHIKLVRAISGVLRNQPRPSTDDDCSDAPADNDIELVERAPVEV